MNEHRETLGVMDSNGGGHSQQERAERSQTDLFLLQFPDAMIITEDNPLLGMKWMVTLLWQLWGEAGWAARELRPETSASFTTP